MISKWTIVYACALLAFCEAAFVETLQKCAVEDSSCLQDLIQSVMKTKGTDGLKEYNIEPFDPIQLRNIKIAILGILNINLDEGEARGVKDCVIDNIVTDAKEGRLVLEATCDLIINAKFKLEEVSPLIQKSFGSNSIEGSGKAKVILDKLHMKFAFLFDYLKKEDGEIYYKIKPEKTVYEYKVGKAKFIAENILLGGQDIGKEVNQFMDENLGFLLKSFGKNFFDVAMDILNNILVKFFDNTPTKYFLSTDLTPYLKTV